MKKRLLFILVILALTYVGIVRQPGLTPIDFSGVAQSDNRQIHEAFRQERSDVQVEGRGIVLKVLPDDSRGSRHQRFIVKLDSGQTLLIAHNIDLAPRVRSLTSGAEIAFYGEYEWNHKGGVIHWTHHDPQGRHADGWIRYRGEVYQ